MICKVYGISGFRGSSKQGEKGGEREEGGQGLCLNWGHTSWLVFTLECCLSARTHIIADPPEPKGHEQIQNYLAQLDVQIQYKRLPYPLFHFRKENS